MSERVARIAAADLMMRSRLEGAARAAGLVPQAVLRVGEPEGEPPALLVADLDAPGAVDSLAAWRERHPSLPIVGFISHVDREGWERAEKLGVRVHPRGASAKNGIDILRDAAGS